MIGTSRWLNVPLHSDPNFNNAMFASPNPTKYFDFDDAYRAMYGSYPLRIASLAYDAVTAVMESYAQAKDKKNIKQALENYQGFEGVNGRYRFLSTGSLERRYDIVRISDGKFEIIDHDDKPFLRY